MKYLLLGEETERLIFRKLVQEDFDEWIEIFKEKDVPKFLGLDASLSPHKLCELWFEKVFNRYNNNLGGHNVLVDKKTNQMIGHCGLLVQNIENEERLEIGYSILPKFWRMGYAFEAAKKCKDFAFENNFAKELISVVHVENIGSEKVARKNGMHFEKFIENYKGFPVNIFKIENNQ